MRKLTITNCEVEGDKRRLVTIVLLSGVVVIDGVSVNVNTRAEVSAIALAENESVEWALQQCVSNLLKAVEPTEVDYASNTSAYISSWFSSPATTTVVPGTSTFGVGTFKPQCGVYYGGGASTITASGPGTFVLNNTAETVSTT